MCGFLCLALRALKRYNESMFFRDFFQALSDHAVRYVVVGGVAVALHGVNRFTADIDLAIGLDDMNLRSFLSVMDEFGMVPRAPLPAEELLDATRRRMWHDEKGMTAFTFHHPSKIMQQVDIFIEEDIPFESLAGDAVVFSVFGIDVPVVSLDHLRQMKLKAARPQDLADVDALNELERLDGKK
jgi:hypothetical protein